MNTIKIKTDYNRLKRSIKGLNGFNVLKTAERGESICR